MRGKHESSSRGVSSSTVSNQIGQSSFGGGVKNSENHRDGHGEAKHKTKEKRKEQDLKISKSGSGGTTNILNFDGGGNSKSKKKTKKETPMEIDQSKYYC